MVEQAFYTRQEAQKDAKEKLPLLEELRRSRRKVLILPLCSLEEENKHKSVDLMVDQTIYTQER